MCKRTGIFSLRLKTAWISTNVSISGSKRIQHDVKKREFLIHFSSRILPAETYYNIERYLKETVGEKTKLFVAYRDLGDVNAEDLEAHIKELCCHVKRGLPVHYKVQHVF